MSKKKEDDSEKNWKYDGNEEEWNTFDRSPEGLGAGMRPGTVGALTCARVGGGA